MSEQYIISVSMSVIRFGHKSLHSDAQVDQIVQLIERLSGAA